MRFEMVIYLNIIKQYARQGGNRAENQGVPIAEPSLMLPTGSEPGQRVFYTYPRRPFFFGAYYNRLWNGKTCLGKHVLVDDQCTDQD
jgi:hypothetical protein